MGRVIFIFAAMVFALVPGAHAASGQQAVVEWAPFTIAKGVNEMDLIPAGRELHDRFLSGQKGFLRRELLKGDGGKWVDIVWWQTREDAEAAAKKAQASPTCARYFSFMENVEHNDPSAGVAYFVRMKEWKNK